MEFYILIGKGFSFACWLFHVKEVGEIEAPRTEERERKKGKYIHPKKNNCIGFFFSFDVFNVFHVPGFSTCSF